MTRTAGGMIGAGLVGVTVMLSIGSVTGSTGEDARQVPCRVTLTAGDVQGVDFGSSCAFLGIPYAAPTGGENRWKPPQPPTPWTPSLLQATTPPPGCPSIALFGTTQPPSSQRQ
jgi:para-nitrobenzyl esterase